MSNNGDDDLERRLRDVLHSRGLGVPVPPDAIDRVHAGAQRRQRRRMVASTSAAAVAVVVLAVAGISVGVRPHGHGTTVAAKVGASSSSPPASAAASVLSIPLVTESPGVATSPPVAVSSAPVFASTPPVQVFNPVSVSAIGVSDYWVLGYITAASGPDGITIMKTTDAGQHFTKVGAPAAFVAQMVATVPPGTPIVSDIRFGDTKNGWAYGNGLFQTADGGGSWLPVTGVPGNVVDLAAASGNVWAVSNTTNTSSYSLYHATYGNSGTGTWTKVPLGTSIIGEPGLAVVKQDAFLLAQVGNGHGETFVIAGDGKSLVSNAAPCASSGNTVSVAGDGALWIRCSGDNTISVFVSNDQAAHWQAVSAASAAGSVGGVDATQAVIESTDGLHVISSTGDSAPVPYAPGASQALPGFIGFTTTTTGFIVTDGIGAQLWRTTDGGQTWSVVKLG
jgi:hypothetical protein